MNATILRTLARWTTTVALGLAITACVAETEPLDEATELDAPEAGVESIPDPPSCESYMDCYVDHNVGVCWTGTEWGSLKQRLCASCNTCDNPECGVHYVRRTWCEEGKG